MAKEVSLADVFEPIKLNLMGPKYLLKAPTRSLEEKTEQWSRMVDELEDDEESFDRDAQVKALIEMIDLALEPVDVAEGERPKTAKTVLSKLYKDDKIGKATLDGFLGQIRQLREEQRPI